MRRVGKRKIEFVGWGSRPLIDFLEAIGQNTVEKHSRHEVAAFIAKYINNRGLASAEKKKKVLCDERLHALFGKKIVSRIKVYDMLEEHFAENQDDSDDELLDSLDDEDYGVKSSLSSRNNPIGEMKKVKTPKSCFAAVIPENMKLLYLKKSVIQELLQFPESFEFKIVGSFVRMKSDPNDIYQKNRFQLQQVTGVEKVSCAGDAGIEIHLKVSNFFKDVPICMLSDDNFSKEELEDIQDRIKAGLLNRLTVNELQSKAQVLHADITKHWIAKEISLLHKLIDQANEKGWRRELFEYLGRRKMLQTPSEQEKLLLKVPEVIAEELQPEGIVAAASERAESACSPKSILRGGSSDVSSTDVLGDRPADIIEQEMLVGNVICDRSSTEMQAANSGEQDVEEKQEKPITAGVIELSDTESLDEDPKSENVDTGETPDDVIWHYVDPRGQKRGPFSLYLLKRWSDANYFDLGFRVWKNGQTSDDGVLLVDVLHRIFSN